MNCLLSGMNWKELVIHLKCKTGNQLIFFNNPVNVLFTLRGLRLHSHKLIIFQPSFFNALAAFTSLAMLPFILFSHHSVLVLGTTKYLQSLCLPESSHVQILPFYILVKQYQVCRGGFYRGACNEIRWHVKIYAPAFRALYSCP